MKSAIAGLLQIVKGHRRLTLAPTAELAGSVTGSFVAGGSDFKISAQSDRETAVTITSLQATAEGRPPGVVHPTWNSAESVR